MQELYYKIKDVANNKYFYRKEVINLNLYKTLFTKRIENAKIISDYIEANHLLDICKACNKNSKFKILKLNLVEKTNDDYIKSLNKRKFIFKIRNKKERTFIKGFIIHQQYNHVETTEKYGNFFQKHSVAKNFIKNILRFYGVNYLTDAIIFNEFEIVPYVFENVFIRTLLIEKNKKYEYF